MICNNCGFDNAATNQICARCGYPIYQSTYNNAYGYDPGLALKISAAKEEMSTAKTLAIVGLVLSLTASSLVGFILGLVAKSKYNDAMAKYQYLPEGKSTKSLANATIAIGIIRFIISIAVIIFANVMYGFALYDYFK